MSISKTAYYYVSKKINKDSEITDYLRTLAIDHPRWGFEKMMQKIKLDHKPWNHKRVYRLYCELKLNIRVKPRKRLPKGEAKMLLQPIKANVCWSMDFMSDALTCGRRFRTFNVIDDYNREALLIAASFSLPSCRVIQLLDQLAVEKGYPEMIRVDNGTEFTSHIFRQWADKHQVLINYIQPGKPAQNGFIERFNRTYREDILDMNLFSHLREVRLLTQDWIVSYNKNRPHEALAGLTPAQFSNYRQHMRVVGKEEDSLLK